MWFPWQRARLLDALRNVDATEREMIRVRQVFIQINRVMVVITTKLFARRQEQMRIDKLTVAHNGDNRRPLPPLPHEVTPGAIYVEYERISKIGMKTKKTRTQSNAPSSEVSDVDALPLGEDDVEHEDVGQGRLDVSPQDEEDRIAPADDRVLDNMDEDDVLPRRAVPEEEEVVHGVEEATRSTPVGD